jgi:hypothetical protein
MGVPSQKSQYLRNIEDIPKKLEVNRFAVYELDGSRNAASALMATDQMLEDAELSFSLRGLKPEPGQREVEFEKHLRRLMSMRDARFLELKPVLVGTVSLKRHFKSCLIEGGGLKCGSPEEVRKTLPDAMKRARETVYSRHYLIEFGKETVPRARPTLT